MRKFICFLAGIWLALISHAQTVEVTGKVTDNNGLPVPNATIQEKVSKKGTVSDMNGNFHISLSKGQTIRISSVGFETKEVAVNSAGTINVALTPTNQSLSEVVVTGVGVATSKKKLGIAVEAITTDKITPVPTSSIDQFLVGKVAGAQITWRSCKHFIKRHQYVEQGYFSYGLT
jgi:TonB-dependent starch-binding outer membrane protein SusC